MSWHDQESARQRVLRVHPEGGAAESGNGKQRAVADEPDSSDEALIAYVRGRLPRLRRPGSRPRRPGGRTSRPRSLWFADLPRPLTRRRTLRFPESSAGRGCRGRSTPNRAARPADPPSLAPRGLSRSGRSRLAGGRRAVPRRPGGDARYAPVSEQSRAGLTVSVAFGATERSAIRALLREMGARISDGPSAIGLWQLSFAGDAARDAGLARLQAAEIVESAQVN